MVASSGSEYWPHDEHPYHPNIVQVKEAVVDAGSMYMVSPYPNANPNPNPNPNPDPNPNPNPNPEQVRKGSIDLPAKKLPSSVGVSLPVIGSVRVNLVSTRTGPQALALALARTLTLPLIIPTVTLPLS